MKAKIKDRNNVEKHVKLGEVVPLTMPYVVVLDPSNLCNLKCKFCPTGNHDLVSSTGRYQGLFDFSLFEKIIKDLQDFDEPLRVLRLYKEGEPLINPQFAEMVAYAKKSGFVKRVDTTTNGVLLNPRLNKKIIDAGIDQINISVNGLSSEQYEYYTQTKVDFNEYVNNIKDLYANRGNCEVCVKAIHENLSEEDRKHFFEIFGNIADRVFLEHINPKCWPEFSFRNDLPEDFSLGHWGQEAKEREVCPFIFYILVINSDGKASACIQDWQHKLVVGDLRIQSVKEVWLSQDFNSYRVGHLKHQRGNIEFCGACESITYGTLDNLDDYTEEILERMKSV